MALSQKHSGKILVPWYSSHEWKYVYSLIYSETSTQSDRKKALEILQIWKTRMPILFAGLEGTLIILNAMLHEETTFTKDQLSSFYALAIMRFLNLCAANSDQQGTFFRIAKERNLPEWLVSIRHDLAHSQKQSSLFMLRKGIEYCFEWLKYEYWELQDRKITDFLVSTVTTDDIKEKIHLCCKYINCTIFKEKLNSSITNMLKELNTSKYSTSNEILQNLLRGNHLSIEKMVEIIVENNYMFVGITDTIEKIPNLHVVKWEPVFQYLSDYNMLMNIILKLHEICLNSEDLLIEKISSLWLKEIFAGLSTNGKQNQHNINSELDQYNTYVMKLQPPDETFIRQLKELSDHALQNPHPLFKNYSAGLMTLCAYKETFTEDVNNLLDEYFHPHITLKTPYIPMTIENIKEAIGIDTFEGLSFTVERTLPTPPKKWTKIEDTCNYEGCPIGILPYQNRDHNPTISF